MQEKGMSQKEILDELLIIEIQVLKRRYGLSANLISD
jgi:hypothetical protein